MRKIYALFVIFLALISCENTEKPTPAETGFKLLGRVNFKMMRLHESGRFLGNFYVDHYLSGIKVELLSNGNVIETTTTIADTSVDFFYIFKTCKVETPYQIRISLNPLMIRTTNVFTIHENEIVDLPVDSLNEEMFKEFSWFTKGKYYLNYNSVSDSLTIFDLYSDNNTFSINPCPFTADGARVYFKSDKQSLNILTIMDLKLNSIDTIYNKNSEPGSHNIQFGPNLKDGLYLMELNQSGEKSYRPFLKGAKGAPKMP